VKSARPLGYAQSLARETDASSTSRRFKHRLATDGIESVCLACGQLVGAAQNEWLLLTLELVHECTGNAEQ
jgi:hypothetical protein